MIPLRRPRKRYFGSISRDKTKEQVAMNNLFLKVYLAKFVFRKRVIFSADVTNLALYKRWNDSTLFQTFHTVEDLLFRRHSVRKTRTRLNVSSEETLAILARLKKIKLELKFILRFALGRTIIKVKSSFRCIHWQWILVKNTHQHNRKRLVEE